MYDEAGKSFPEEFYTASAYHVLSVETGLSDLMQGVLEKSCYIQLRT